jgi:hypothetical protein
MALQAGVILFRASSEKVQELAHINLGLPQETSECSNLDRLVERNDATPAAAPHHHMAAVLANRLKAQALQGADDLPSGKVRELRHAPER